MEDPSSEHPPSSATGRTHEMGPWGATHLQRRRPKAGRGVMCALATLEALLELLDYSGQEGARE